MPASGSCKPIRPGTRFIAGLASLVGLCVYLFLSSDPEQVEPEPTSQIVEQRLLRAVVDRIDAESLGKVPVPRIEAPPRSASLTMVPTVPPEPPEGYSFPAFRGEMMEGRMTARTRTTADLATDSLDWLGLPTSVAELVRQAARSNRLWSYGWIRLVPEARLSNIDSALSGLGVEVVGSAGRFVRARLPGNQDKLEAIVRLTGVDGVGAMPPREKLAQSLLDALQALPARDRIPVLITLMDGDRVGRWRQALETLGATVGDFDSAIRVYPAIVNHESLTAVASADFVLAVEPVGVVQAATTPPFLQWVWMDYAATSPATVCSRASPELPSLSACSIPGLTPTTSTSSPAARASAGRILLRVATRLRSRTIYGLTPTVTAPM